MTGATIFTVSRTLSNWEQRGLIDSGRQRIVLREPDALRAVAEAAPDEDNRAARQAVTAGATKHN